ncbi:MAG: sigma-70 family RNA polymerase sigma factor [Deltaproteobacteria bacterium]
MDAKQLLADAAWLRRLASALAGESEADDVVQESWIAAWRKQPDTERPLRPWLAKVAHDVVAMRRRGDQRRRVREARLVEAREVETPDAMLERVRLQRVLADLVLELAEPYRSAIVARFFEGKSAAQVSRELGIPDATVRARIREGLARLRAGLDRETGGGKAWAALFLRGGIRVAKPTKAILVIVALIIALLAGSVALIVRRDPAPPRSASAGPSASTHEGRARPTLPASEAISARGGRRIAGRVTADGNPVVHARVKLVGTATLERTTDDTGHFDFGLMPMAGYSVGAIEAGRLAEVQRIDTRDSGLHADGLELVLLPCEGSLFGRVTDPSGAAIAGAEVLREDVIGINTDDQGRYELCIRRVALENDELRTVVRAPGFAAQELVTATHGHYAYDFILVPEALVRGRVIDESGAPIAGATIRVTTPEPQRAVTHHGLVTTAPATVASDDAGAFVVRGLDRGAHHFVARAPGLVATTDDANTNLTVTLHSSAIVHGRVVSGATPMAKVSVTIDDTTVLTAQDGSFEIDDAMTGDTKPTLAPYRPRIATMTLHPGTNDVLIDVEPTVTVRGTVREHGAAVANARLMVSDGANYHACYSDADGHFELPGMASGHYKGGVDTMDAFADIDWTIAASDVTHDLDLSKAGTIAGVVVDSTNAPVAGVVVRFQSTTVGSNFDRGRCTTDASGTFSCGHMAGGAYKPAVYFTENGQPALHLEHEPIVIADGSTRVDHVRLVVDARRLEIHGTVKDRTGTAVPNARVIASNGREGNTAPLNTLVTDDAGAFVFRGLAAGSYTVEAETATEHGATVVEAGSVASVVIGGCDPSRGADPATRPAQRRIWDDRVELLGWDAPPSVRIGAPMTMTLYFKVLQTTDLPYNVFVHVAGEHRWINADHTPQGGRCETTDWKTGDVIVDRFTFPTAVDANGAPNPPGTYSIDVGLFRGQPGNWQNLPTATPGPIGTVRLE